MELRHIFMNPKAGQSMHADAREWEERKDRFYNCTWCNYTRNKIVPEVFY